MTRLVTRPGRDFETRANRRGGRRVSGRAVAATVAVAAGAAGGGWAYGYGPLARNAPPAATQAIPLSTTVVRLGTLTVREEDAGTIGYASPFTVYASAAGTLTWLPGASAVIQPGNRLFAVDGQDTLLLRGGTPAWRAFKPGMTDGADVRELQRNLIALGYDPHRSITVDGTYDWATQAAVESWQAALGRTQDAWLPLGEVAFLPGPVRVAEALSGAGATVAVGTAVLAATSTTPVVTVSLAAGGQAQVRTGNRVDITLPDGTNAPGRVLSVAAATSSGTVGGSDGSSSSSGGSGGSSGQGSGQAQEIVTVSLAASVASLDGASVQVAITTQQQPDALIVPISALMARPGGSYQVTVVTARTPATRNVMVTPGLFDDLDGLVAISGPGITAGTTVQVPAS